MLNIPPASLSHWPWITVYMYENWFTYEQLDRDGLKWHAFLQSITRKIQSHDDKLTQMLENEYKWKCIKNYENDYWEV